MIEVDMGGAVVEELAGLKRVERNGDKINLVFEGITVMRFFLLRVQCVMVWFGM